MTDKDIRESFSPADEANYKDAGEFIVSGILVY